jgi:hypothetical protein
VYGAALQQRMAHERLLLWNKDDHQCVLCRAALLSCALQALLMILPLLLAALLVVGQ